MDAKADTQRLRLGSVYEPRGESIAGFIVGDAVDAIQPGV